MLRMGAWNRKGLGPFTLPEIVLYIVAAIAMLIFTLVLTGYAGKTVPKMSMPNERQLLANYVADALISLPNWDGECGCLAKSVSTPEGEVIYPGLIPEWKLESLDTDCRGRKRFCTIPYLIDKEWAGVFITVTDLETSPAKIWTTTRVSGSSESEDTKVYRLVGIEYEDGRVHAGKIAVSVYN